MSKSSAAEALITRQKTIDAAVKIAMTSGPCMVTFGNVAKEVGITRSGVGCHFKKKTDLYKAMTEPLVSEMFEPISFETIPDFYKSWVAALKDNKKFRSTFKSVGTVITYHDLFVLITQRLPNCAQSKETVLRAIALALVDCSTS